MKTSTTFLAIVIFTIYIGQTSAATDKVVCYFGSSARYRLGSGNFTVESINAQKCSHLIYTFISLNSDGSIRILDEWNDVTQRGLERFNNLKLKNPNLKTLMAIGGWQEGSSRFSAMAASPATRAAFITNAVNFMSKYGYDGLTFDSEYPAQRGGIAADKANFAMLLNELRAKIDANSKKYLLTASVAATSSYVDVSYDVPALSQYLDFINVMAYGFHGSYDGRTGQNAPLYASNLDVSVEDKQKNVESIITLWISRGANPQKLILGIAAFGRSFTLSTVGSNKLGDPASNPGTKGPYTAEAGMLGYNEICEMQKASGWTYLWDDMQKVPYVYKGNQWVGYDDVKSIKLKATFAKSKNLGGVMISSIDTDDFLGICGAKYPLLSAINEVIMGTAPPMIPSLPSATTAKSATTKASSTSVVCTSPGFIRDPVVCSRFYECVANANTFVKYERNCPTSLEFDTNTNTCNYAEYVNC